MWLAMFGLMSTSRSDVADQAAQIGGDGAGTGPNAHGHRGHGTPSPSGPSGTPVTTSPVRDPFTLYDSGPKAADWSPAQVDPAEQAVIKAGKDVTAWQGINDAWAGAVAEHSRAAAAEAAATQLGVANLGQQGVAP